MIYTHVFFSLADAEASGEPRSKLGANGRMTMISDEWAGMTTAEKKVVTAERKKELIARHEKEGSVVPQVALSCGQDVRNTIKLVSKEVYTPSRLFLQR